MTLKKNHSKTLIKNNKKLIKNGLTNKYLELPNLKFTEEQIATYQCFLLEEEGIKIPFSYLKRTLNNTKRIMYRKELKNHISLDQLHNIQGFIESYLKIYGYNINEYYVLGMKEISSLSQSKEQLIEQIEQEQKRRQKKQKIIEMSKIINSEENINNTPTISDIDLMEGLEFEQFLGELFKKLGYKTEVTKGSNDQGADLILEKETKIVVQAKRYSNKVNNSAVQEVIAAKAYYGAGRAMVVTNNYYTKSAEDLAKINKVELWDRDKLIEMLKYI